MTSDMIHEVEIAAAPAKVYQAITTSEGQRGSWTPGSTLEPKVGSEAVFRFKSAPVPLRMRIDALEPGRRVAWTCLGDFPGWKDTTVTWTLTPAADGKATKLEFRHGSLAGYPVEAIGTVNYTWGQVVSRLKAYVETGKPQPYIP